MQDTQTSPEAPSSELRHEINDMIRGVAFFFSFALLAAVLPAALYTGESAGQVLSAWLKILTSPCPLVTDYFRLGSLAAAFLNAGICGMVCALLIRIKHAKHRPNIFAGFFLVIAHCFYGLNLVNMVPPMLGFFVYCRVHRLRFRDNLDWAMFITSFAPFFSELLFRYPVALDLPLSIGAFHINLVSVGLCCILAVFVGFVLPAILPGTSKLHRGFNLYNGGLATGLLGLFIYSFLYRTMGVSVPEAEPIANAVYDAHGNSYQLFAAVFYGLVFGACILQGWLMNGCSFAGYGALLADDGYKANFPKQYGVALTWMNLGFYGLMMTAWFNAVILLTEGAGFTGATVGIILAAMTFAAAGQHPANVWPILVGYAALSLLVTMLCRIGGQAVPWTLSTQGYMNGLAFATGLCPFTGKFGRRVGVLAGFISAVMCTTTSVMHGGFVLYNGGLTAGISALLLLPLLDTYLTHDEKWGRGHFRD